MIWIVIDIVIDMDQLLQENGYQESITSKIFKSFPNNHRLSQSQKQTQATDIQEEDITGCLTDPKISE